MIGGWMEDADQPFIVTGDFNAGAHTAFAARARRAADDAWELAGRGPGTTWPNGVFPLPPRYAPYPAWMERKCSFSMTAKPEITQRGGRRGGIMQPARLRRAGGISPPGCGRSAGGGAQPPVAREGSGTGGSRWGPGASPRIKGPRGTSPPKAPPAAYPSTTLQEYPPRSPLRGWRAAPCSGRPVQ